jgi:predicted RNase H-like HicB family nuclease
MQGESVEECLSRARDAIDLALEVRRDAGEDIPASDAEVVRVEHVGAAVPVA